VTQHSVLDQDRIAQLIAAPRGEDPVISLYLKSWGPNPKATLKNLIREGEEAIEADTGWDAGRKKEARGLLDGIRQQAEGLLEGASTQGRGSHALFARSGGGDQLSLPVDLRERIVVDRSPYASPLSSVIDQYERYGVIICDHKKATLFEVYLGEIESWEQFESEHQRHRRAPAGGPQRSATKGRGSFQGLEELRRRNHAGYVLHQHLAEVADRAFRRFRVRPFDRLILGGNKDVMPKLEEHLHSYLKERVVAREQLSLALSKKDAREKIVAIEARVEEEKEVKLLKTVRDRLGSSGLGSTGLDETLRSLFYGKVEILIVLDDGDAIPGRECPECNFLFERPEDTDEKTPTLVECPICKRATRRVPDIIDEAVELAIMSGARVEHIAYAKAQLRQMGWAAAVLRFK